MGLTAGRQQVSTDVDAKGTFYQPLALLVEQGTEAVEVELMDGYADRALAALSLDPRQDILLKLKSEGVIRDKTFPMKAATSKVVNPRVKLTIRMESKGESSIIMEGMEDISPQTVMMLEDQVSQIDQSKYDRKLTNLELISKACCGP